MTGALALAALNTHLSDLLVEEALEQGPGRETFTGLDLLGADEDTAATFLPTALVDRLAATDIAVEVEHTFSFSQCRTVVTALLTVRHGDDVTHRAYHDDDAHSVRPLDLLHLEPAAV